MAFWSRCKISACEFGLAQKAKFFGFKSDTAVLTFTFHFLSSLFFRVSCLILFSFAGHLIGFILVGKVFRKGFRILGFDERKGRWVVEQDFHGNFPVNVTWFFAFFSSVFDWILLILVWFEISLHSAHSIRQSDPWPLKLMTSQAVEGMRIRTGGHGWLRANGLIRYILWWNHCNSDDDGDGGGDDDVIAIIQRFSVEAFTALTYLKNNKIKKHVGFK